MKNLHNPSASGTPISGWALQEGIASLSRGICFREATLDMVLSILTESAAKMAGVGRASIWALTDDHSELRCLSLYETASGRHVKGDSVHSDHYPVYFEALRNGGGLAADDALLHPLTAEFAADYLPRHNVTAVLDAPIHIRGDLQGVFCLEQVGARRPWSVSCQLFAQAVANLVTLALVEHEAEEARRQAQAARERLRAVADVS